MNHPSQKSTRLTLTFLLISLIFLVKPQELFAQCSVSIATTVTNITCFNGTNGSIVVTASGGVAPYQYQLAEAGAGAWQSGNTFTALSANTYPVSVKDALGCLQTVYVSVTQPAAISIAYTESDNTCFGSNNGIITTTATGGTAPYTYAWAKNTVAGFATTANLANLTPGSYLLTLTDSRGCTSSPIINQKIVPMPGLTGLNADVIANGTHLAANSALATSQPLDNGGDVFYATGYSNTGGTTGSGGLPTTGAFNSAQDATRPYQLNSYSLSNALVLMSAAGTFGSVTSGTLTLPLNLQAPYATIYVVGTTGNGTGVVNYTVNYSDLTTSTGSINFPDWSLPAATASTVRALGSLDRVAYSAASGFDGATSFNLWEAPITVASSNKIVTSINFAWSNASTSTARIDLFAMTGYTSTAFGIRVNDGLVSNVAPSVTITSDAPASTFCSGQTVTFTAAPVNGGTAPTYQWKLNGVNAGTNSATYTNSSLANGNTVSVVMTPTGLTCLVPAFSTSNVLTMHTGTVAASVSIAASQNPVCNGSSVTFTATPTNGGTSPSYQWKIGTTSVGTNAPTYTSSALANGNSVTTVMTSGISCATGSPGTSNAIVMTVNPVTTPTASISSVPGMVFSSSATNAGTTPTYQWFDNGTAISGANGTVYSNSSPVLGDVYSMKLTSNYTCSSQPSIMSNFITVTPITLPILLSSYTLTVQDRSVHLNWTTAQESNNKEFLIERANTTDGVFAIVGQIPATNRSTGSSYSYTDHPGAPGIYLYRLVQVDLDGAQHFFEIKTADLSGGSNWTVTDAGSSWQLISNQPVTYALFTMDGKLLEKGKMNGTKAITKPTSASVYLLRVQINGQTVIRKLIK